MLGRNEHPFLLRHTVYFRTDLFIPVYTFWRRIGVVKFVTSRCPCKSEMPLLCPKATMTAIKRLSPQDEDDEDEVESGPEGNVSPIGSIVVLRNHGTGFSSDSSTGENGDFTREEDSRSLDDQNVEQDYIHFYGDDSECLAMEARVDDEKSDFELTDILESLGDVLECAFDKTESSGVRYIGVMEDRSLILATIPKTKRVLSHNALAAINTDDGRSDQKPKRAKSGNLKELSPVGTNLLSTFSLGPPALQSFTTA